MLHACPRARGPACVPPTRPPVVPCEFVIPPALPPAFHAGVSVRSGRQSSRAAGSKATRPRGLRSDGQPGSRATPRPPDQRHRAPPGPAADAATSAALVVSRDGALLPAARTCTKSSTPHSGKCRATEISLALIAEVPSNRAAASSAAKRKGCSRRPRAGGGHRHSDSDRLGAHY